MPKKRRLSDLYVRGCDVTLDDGQGDPIVVWLQKLNPLDHESAMRKANASRSRVLALKRKREGEDFEALMSQVYDLDESALVDYLIAPEVQKYQFAREEEIAAEEEWSENDYLQGLRDAWNDGLEMEYAADPENEEAKKVLDELKRFDAQVSDLVGNHEEELRSSYEALSIDELHRRVADQFIQMQADIAWVREFHQCELFYGTREPDDHRKYYFENREELDSLPEEVQAKLLQSYREMIVDVIEGKDLPETEGSSPLSEQPTQEEPATSSGRKAAKR